MEFIDSVAENGTIGNMVYELLLKNGKDLNSTIEHKNGYYAVNGRELILMLESATQEIVNAVLAAQPDKIIALNRLFEGNDQLKINTAPPIPRCWYPLQNDIMHHTYVDDRQTKIL